MLEDVWYYFRIFPESTEGLLFQYIANHPGNCKAEVSEVPWKLRCDLQWNRFNETPIALSHQFHCRFHARSTHASCSGVSVKARCSIEVVSEAFGIFPINFRTKCLLWHVHVHFDCAGSHKMLAPGIWVLHFPYKFPHKMPLLMSMCMSIVQARTKRWPREKRPAFSL